MLGFCVTHSDGDARAGLLRLPGGKEMETPCMMVYMHRGGAPNLTADLLEVTVRPSLHQSALHLNVFHL